MRGSLAALAASAMLLTISAATHEARAGDGPEASGVVAGRQAAMRMSGALVGAMKGAVTRNEDVKGQGFAARSLAAWARAIPGMFPVGSGAGETEALPAVWSDRAGFEGKAATYAAAAGKLAEAAKAGDAAAFSAALGEVQGACKGCHDSYKKPDTH
ncbi:cytochrome c [Sphingomonas sp.]|uniref:cytochrome c n=1 Tax=Sphingomonas sp. TaxID=28214 RepID=UPI001B012BFD|nr:cytochrome c [Sphingomonas sp.]MBO9712319.1 cytochrome c [Sphingomonas sp.]